VVELSQLRSQIDENKTELLSFLSGVLHDSIQLADKEIVVTEGDDVLSKPLLMDTSALAACNHEEAISDITLHAARAAHSRHKKILIRTVDTDVVVLAVALARTTKEEIELRGSLSASRQATRLIGSGP